jgi:hypothetical protein
MLAAGARFVAYPGPDEMADESPKTPKTQPDQEHPLANILINVLVPVMALSFLSKEGGKPWHIGPGPAMVLALALPIGYGIWFFVKTRRANFFSLLGLGSVLLTGGLTLYLWNQDGTVKPNAAILFGLKEASIPFVLGLAVLGSHWTSSPLLRVFLFSDSIFDTAKIEKTVEERGTGEEFRHILWQATLLFAASFFISTVLNFVLAQYFLGGLDHTAHDAREQYNLLVAKITGWGFAVIALPMLVFLGFTLWRLVAGLRRVTGLETDHLLLPR